MVVPHSEVVNVEPTVLIVGWGHVGQCVGRYFRQAYHVDADGIIEHSSGQLQVPSQFELGFLCVPTPSLLTGECDTSIVKAAYEQWYTRVDKWCVRSTVAVGTTESLGYNVCFQPEYYGETLGHPHQQVERNPFIVLGGPSSVTRAFATAWSLVTNSHARIFQTDARTAELCKYMENSFLATKVTFCNEMYDIAQALGIDWNELRELWLLDDRIGRSHTYVYPSNRGWGGKCFPKDTAALCWTAEEAGARAELLEAVRFVNARHRL